jgi:hypothetical protein
MKISRRFGRIIMAYYSPQLLHTMRAALDGVMTQVPMSHATPGCKAHLAEVILQAAAQGVTSYDGLVAAASDQIQTIISMLT